MLNDYQVQNLLLFTNSIVVVIKILTAVKLRFYGICDVINVRIYRCQTLPIYKLGRCNVQLAFLCKTTPQ